MLFVCLRAAESDCCAEGCSSYLASKRLLSQKAHRILATMSWWFVFFFFFLIIMYIILIVELCRLFWFNNPDINKDKQRTKFSSYSAVQITEAQVKLWRLEPNPVEVFN